MAREERRRIKEGGVSMYADVEGPRYVRRSIHTALVDDDDEAGVCIADEELSDFVHSWDVGGIHSHYEDDGGVDMVDPLLQMQDGMYTMPHLRIDAEEELLALVRDAHTSRMGIGPTADITCTSFTGFVQQARDEYGVSVLEHAIELQFVKVVECLLRQGAGVGVSEIATALKHTTNAQGQNILDLIESAQSDRVLQAKHRVIQVRHPEYQSDGAIQAQHRVIQARHAGRVF
jgi:hypothetical protein